MVSSAWFSAPVLASPSASVPRKAAGCAVLFWHPNLPESPLLAHALAFREQFGEDWNWLPNHLAPEMLVRAMNKAQSVDPLKVALALEGMQYNGPTGETWMRAEDHQLMMPLFQTLFTKAGGPGVKYDAEGSGYGWKTESRLDAKDNIPPVLCQVKRPL